MILYVFFSKFLRFIISKGAKTKIKTNTVQLVQSYCRPLSNTMKLTKFCRFFLLQARFFEGGILNLSKSHSTYPTEQSSEDVSIHPDPLRDPYVIEIENIDDIGHEMKLIRKQNESLNIKVDQVRQKRIYDKKVKTTGN